MPCWNMPSGGGSYILWRFQGGFKFAAASSSVTGEGPQ